MNEIERPTPNSARAVRTYPVAPGRLLAAFGRAVETLPRWSAGPSGEGEVRAVRTTRLLRFRDDVKIRVFAEGAGAGAELIPFRFVDGIIVSCQRYSIHR